MVADSFNNFVNKAHNNEEFIEVAKFLENNEKPDLALKLPSIHWNNNEGKREAEKRTGMIANRGDLDYQKFFELAKEIKDFKVNLIFDGLGIAEDKNYNKCESNPSKFLSLMRLFSELNGV